MNVAAKQYPCREFFAGAKLLFDRVCRHRYSAFQRWSSETAEMAFRTTTGEPGHPHDRRRRSNSPI